MRRKVKPTQEPPRLIRELLRLQKYRSQGESTSCVEENIARLSANPAELMVALHWFGGLDRIACVAAYKEQQALALVRETQRTDLTQQESFLLLEALKKEEDRVQAIAQRQLELDRAKRFHGCG